MKKSSVPRLVDVAKEARVSVSAASRILRGDTDRFGEETTQRVVSAAKQLGWRRNLLVSGVRTGITKTVGVMIPPFDSFWINILSGIHNRLSAADYLPITIWLGDLDRLPQFEEGDDEGLRQINRLLDRRVDGLIMWPQIAIAYRKYLSEVATRDVPVVVIDLDMAQPLGDSVLTSEERSTRMVAKHFLDLGHRRIGWIGERNDPSHRWSRVRAAHFERAIAKGADVLTCSGQLNKQGDNGVQVASSLLRHDIRPTAIFAVNDHLARSVYEAAAQLKLRIPEDISVIGFSDLDFAAKMSPPLTTVHQHPKTMGAQAVELVLDRLDSTKPSNAKYESIEIMGELILRESTAPARPR